MIGTTRSRSHSTALTFTREREPGEEWDLDASMPGSSGQGSPVGMLNVHVRGRPVITPPPDGREPRPTSTRPLSAPTRRTGGSCAGAANLLPSNTRSCQASCPSRRTQGTPGRPSAQSSSPPPSVSRASLRPAPGKDQQPINQHTSHCSIAPARTKPNKGNHRDHPPPPPPKHETPCRDFVLGCVSFVPISESDLSGCLELAGTSH